MENSDLLVRAFAGANSVERATERLEAVLVETYSPLLAAAESAAKKISVSFAGMDTSIAPSLEPEESITAAFAAVGLPFGEAGTTAVCGEITKVLKRIPFPQAGYCGLMLSVLEDVGLAQACAMGKFDVTDLLAYASVCGVGIDLAPIPGNVSSRKIEALMLDLCAVSLRQSKPLSARLLPVPGKVAGEATAFDSPYMCNSAVMRI